MKQFYDFKVEKIKDLSPEDKNLRKENLDLFYKNGFPNKKEEDWKFTDLNSILSKNFDNITNKDFLLDSKKLNLINEFKHNHIYLLDGKLISSDFTYEDKNKISIIDFKYKNNVTIDKINSLNLLNNALAKGGFTLEISKNYKLNKPLIIYNYFSKDIKETIINNKNSIILNDNSELTLINYIDNKSKDNFMVNSMENIEIRRDALLKNIFINNSKSAGYFYKYIKSDLEKNSVFENYILSSGLKFNKLDIEIKFLPSNLRPFVNTKIGDLFLIFDRFFPIKSIPIELTAITIKSHLRSKISLENLFIFNFFGKFIFIDG